MNDEIFEEIKKKVTSMISENKKLKAIIKRISKGKANFSDTSEYSNITSNIIGSVFSEYVPELSSEGIKEDICTKLLRGQYADINEILAQVQTALDEETEIKIAPQKAEFPLERVQKAAHSLEDKTVTAETIARRAEACTVNISRSFHDDYMEENAKFRTDAGLKCYINRETDGSCCEWCRALAGRYEYDIFTMPEDIFRRHDNCGCTVTFENGRSRQNVWSKKTWEVHDAPENSAAPVVISPEKVKMLQEKNLPKTLTNGHNGGIINNKGSGVLRIDMQFFAEKDIEKQESASLLRAMRKYNQRIEEHKSYINDPKSHCPDWDSYSEQKKAGLIRHWNKEISNFEESIQNRIDELKKRGEYNE